LDVKEKKLSEMFSRVVVASRNGVVAKSFRRNIGLTAVCCQKTAVATDPIQKLFIDKIHEYSNKSKSSGGKLVDASPTTTKALQDELDKLARQYGAKGPDFMKFPTFTFTDGDLEPVGVQVDIKAAVVEASEVAKKAEDEDKAYFEV